MALVLNLVANGMTAKQIVKKYPYLEEDDVRQVLKYAAWLPWRLLGWIALS